ERSGGIGEIDEVPDRLIESRRSSGPRAWLKDTNHSPAVIAFPRRARGALPVWQALTERVSGKPANPEVTLVFTDLVGFSSWSLSAGDDAMLKLLRRVSQVVEPPLLEAGGHIVKRMGDGIMGVFAQPVTAGRAAIAARAAGKAVGGEGKPPRMG